MQGGGGSDCGMITIAITKDFETGIPLVDSQHRELVDRLNKVIGLGRHSATEEETEKTLDFLEDYVVKHFADEEKLQAQIGYPKYQSHKEQHAIYIAEIKNLKKEYQQNGASPKYTLNLNNAIVKWVVQHIKLVDREFGKYYLAHK